MDTTGPSRPCHISSAVSRARSRGLVKQLQAAGRVERPRSCTTAVQGWCPATPVRGSPVKMHVTECCLALQGLELAQASEL